MAITDIWSTDPFHGGRSMSSMFSSGGRQVLLKDEALKTSPCSLQQGFSISCMGHGPNLQREACPSDGCTGRVPTPCQGRRGMS